MFFVVFFVLFVTLLLCVPDRHVPLDEPGADTVALHLHDESDFDGIWLSEVYVDAEQFFFTDDAEDVRLFVLVLRKWHAYTLKCRRERRRQECKRALLERSCFLRALWRRDETAKHWNKGISRMLMGMVPFIIMMIVTMLGMQYNEHHSITGMSWNAE